MKQYLDTLRYVRDNGAKKGDRTGTGTTEVFGVQTRYDLADGFPAMTTKKLYFNSVAHELLWFLKGTGNIEYPAQKDRKSTRLNSSHDCISYAVFCLKKKNRQ